MLNNIQITVLENKYIFLNKSATFVLLRRKDRGCLRRTGDDADGAKRICVHTFCKTSFGIKKFVLCISIVTLLSVLWRSWPIAAESCARLLLCSLTRPHSLLPSMGVVEFVWLVQ